MTTPLPRKRSRSSPESDRGEWPQGGDGDGDDDDVRKKTKTHSELDDIGMVAPGEAWAVDVDGILSSPTLPAHCCSSYARGTSITVLCVQGEMRLHYDLLCAVLPHLCALSPSLHAAVLCHAPSGPERSASAASASALPLIQAVGAGYNHFARLGLLHPLGGGQTPLDALVVVDAKGRRRLVLPFGWGAGRHAATPAGRGVRDALMALLRTCIETLVREG